MNTTYDRRHSGVSTVGMLGLLVIVILIGAMLMAESVGVIFELGQTITHAEKIHGDEALIVRDSIANCPNPEYWFNPGSRYQARSCLNDDGSTSVQIFKMLDGKREEVTAFIYKNKKAFIDYIVESGYVNPLWMLP